MITHDEIIIICAVRYALGRMSYMVGDVCKHVELKRKELSRECIGAIIRDIEDELKRYHEVGHTLGMECDERRWYKLLEILREEKGARKCTEKNVNQ